MGFLRRLVREIIKDDLVDLGAMLAYYAVLSLFPMVLFVVSLALLVLPSDVLDQGVQMVAAAIPEGARPILLDRADALIHATTRGFAITGAALALWGASRGAAALGHALDKVFETTETRSWIRRQLVAIAVTIVIAVLMILALALLVLGPLAGHWLMDRFALGGTFDTAWSIGRWIGAGLLVLVLWAIVYRFLPDTRAPFRVFTPGAVCGVVLWLVLSWAFGVYLDHAGNYEATYGTLGGAIVFLTWLWLSNIAMLLGAAINEVLTVPA